MTDAHEILWRLNEIEKLIERASKDGEKIQFTDKLVDSRFWKVRQLLLDVRKEEPDEDPLFV